MTAPTTETTTSRAPGRWSELTVTGETLAPEVRTTIPWVSPEEFKRYVHQVGEASGFSFEHELERRPDLALGERDLGLDRSQTRRRMLLGVALGGGGVVALALGFLFLFPLAAAFGLFLLLMFPAIAAATVGLTIAMQSRWESDLLRVRLDPSTTRTAGRPPALPGRHAPLSVRVFVGRVTSSSTSSKSGTFRSLLGVVPVPTPPREATEIAIRIGELARSSPPGPVSPALDVRVPPGRRSANLVPLSSKSRRPEWYDYPRWFGTLRAVALIVPMLLLMAGAFLVALPWDNQRIDFTPGGPATQSIPGEPWSPTGGTNGELYWYTYDPASSAEVNNVAVVVALCPVGTTFIDPSTCQPVGSGTFVPQTYDDLTISIPAGWHVVAWVNVSAICLGCHTSVRFDAPELAIGIGLLIAGTAVLLPSVVVWKRTRTRVRSMWPD